MKRKSERLGAMSPAQFATYLVRAERHRIATIVLISVLVSVLVFLAVIMPLTGSLPRLQNVKVDTDSNPHVCYQDGAKISAHRAGGDLAPEETMEAFKLCVEATDYKVDILEFDLHLTKDGHLVLLHDDTVDRTSNGREHFGEKNILVKDKTLAELKELNFGENFETLDGAFPYRGLRGDQIPEDVKILTLEEILTYLVGRDLDYIIEIKDGGEVGERAMDILYEALVRYNILDRTIVGTFQGNVTKYIDQKYPEVTRSASIIEVLGFYYSFLFNVQHKDFAFDVLQIPQLFRGYFDLGTESLIRYAHDNGLAVQYWTINDAEDIERLVNNGADTIITDNPEVAYKVIHGDASPIPTVDYAAHNNFEYSVEDKADYIVYSPQSVKATYGLLFYLGTAISAENYDYLASALAKQGYLVVINKNPFAWMMYKADEPAFEDYPDVKFFVGGHSQGGGAAVKRAKENLDKVQGLVLLAPLAYETDSVADKAIQTLLINATKDGVLTQAMKDESKRAIPADRTEYTIEGAHMSFSTFDSDDTLSMFRDGPVTEDVKTEQKRLTVEYVLAFLVDTIGKTPMPL